MKIEVGCVFVIFFALASAEMQCSDREPNIPKEWVTMTDSCVHQCLAQIKEEIKASIQYLAMGAYFLIDKNQKPGFAELFIKAASEERSHAEGLISYLLYRGELTKNVSNLIDTPVIPEVISWKNGEDALKFALKLEATVSRKIVHLIEVCENPKNQAKDDHNDFHFVDFLTTKYLEEQYDGQRDLANKLSVLGKMTVDHPEFAELKFDQMLLNGKI